MPTLTIPSNRFSGRCPGRAPRRPAYADPVPLWIQVCSNFPAATMARAQYLINAGLPKRYGHPAARSA